MGPVAIAGFGRFGRALAQRLDESEIPVRAWDPLADVPAPARAADPAELVRDARVVVLAVPVPATTEALTTLAPHLTPEHLVIEVGSVKVEPEAALHAVLGARVPWVATHPLFGPVSLALGERPLRVVVCPNPLHPAAEAAGIAFWRELRCDVAVIDAERHDRQMASTHALAFFVAKGFERCGVDLDAPFLPPSVGGIARTVASARADAGQLLATLNRSNPYAADARARLLEALAATDAALRAPPGPGEVAHRESDALRLAQVPRTPPELQTVRDLIDDLDADLVHLLSRRAELALRARSAKASHGRGVTDPRREEELLAARRAAAVDAELDPDAVEDVFRAILRFSRLHQSRNPTTDRPPEPDR